MPDVYEGTPEQLEQYLKRLPQGRRYRLTELPATRPEPTEQEVAEANARLRRHIVSLGYVTGLDNERIDADLAREYANHHETD